MATELVAIIPTQPPSLLSSNFEAHFSLKAFFESLMFSPPSDESYTAKTIFSALELILKGIFKV